uniref:Uncharacterized protein LOC100179925 n=1 Tax=Phallusia mammillata TaxID=59560 RepID=A0A6F9DHS7_9ASCI|nr:uncharacterized protein LOC100179925 [Phallusia mammillata]
MEEAKLQGIRQFAVTRIVADIAVMSSSSPSTSQTSSSSGTSGGSSLPSDKLTEIPRKDDSADQVLLDQNMDELSFEGDESRETVRGPYFYKMRKIGITQLVIALLCIVISIPLTVEIHRSSAGSGIWCSAFFILMSGLNFTSSNMTRPFRVMVAFAATSVYFGVLMLAVESVELAMLISDEADNPSAICLHIVLCMFALTEIVLTIMGAVLCKRESMLTSKEVGTNDSLDADASKPVNLILAHVV